MSDSQFRATPSAGLLYPIETYLFVNRVSEMAAGLYHYPVRKHELELLKEGDYSSEVKGGALDQAIVQRAAVVFIWSAMFSRSNGPISSVLIVTSFSMRVISLRILHSHLRHWALLAVRLV